MALVAKVTQSSMSTVFMNYKDKGTMVVLSREANCDLKISDSRLRSNSSNLGSFS